MSAHGPGLLGVFSYDLAAGTWTWSDELYRLHGFERGEVLPTSEVLLSHVHPDDRARVEPVLAEALEQPGRYSSYHRIIDSREREHRIFAVGTTTAGPDGRPVELTGYFVDLTQASRDQIQPAVEEAMVSALEHRDVVEQAKGAIMLAHCIDADAAFDVLRTISQHANRRVHEVADQIVHGIPAAACGDPAEELLDRLILEIYQGAHQASESR